MEAWRQWPLGRENKCCFTKREKNRLDSDPAFSWKAISPVTGLLVEAATIILTEPPFWGVGETASFYNRSFKMQLISRVESLPLPCQFVGDVVLVNIIYVGHCLFSDLLGHLQFDVPKPLVRIQTFFSRPFA